MWWMNLVIVVFFSIMYVAIPVIVMSVRLFLDNYETSGERSKSGIAFSYLGYGALCVLASKMLFDFVVFPMGGEKVIAYGLSIPYALIIFRIVDKYVFKEKAHLL